MRHTSDGEIDAQVGAFGENMRAARHDAGLSQVALSEATKLDRAAISFLERAERAPDLSTLVRVARALGTTPGELLTDVGLPLSRGGSGPDGVQRSGDGGLRFGEKAVVDRAAISVYERGRREPNLRTVLKLARALGLSPMALLDGVE